MYVKRGVDDKSQSVARGSVVRRSGLLKAELQHLAVGMTCPALPGMTEGFMVLASEPERLLILGWLSPQGRPLVTWTFVLEPPHAISADALTLY
jgi:hypothetical protein